MIHGVGRNIMVKGSDIPDESEEAKLIKSFFSAKNGSREDLIGEINELDINGLNTLEKVLRGYLNIAGKKAELQAIIEKTRKNLNGKEKAGVVVGETLEGYNNAIDVN